jgi:hypothetical protein
MVYSTYYYPVDFVHRLELQQSVTNFRDMFQLLSLHEKGLGEVTASLGLRERAVYYQSLQVDASSHPPT